MQYRWWGESAHRTKLCTLPLPLGTMAPLMNGRGSLHKAFQRLQYLPCCSPFELCYWEHLWTKVGWDAVSWWGKCVGMQNSPLTGRMGMKPNLWWKQAVVWVFGCALIEQFSLFRGEACSTLIQVNLIEDTDSELANFYCWRISFDLLVDECLISFQQYCWLIGALMDAFGISKRPSEILARVTSGI